MITLKWKYGVYIALCTLILVVGIILMGSDKIYADQSYVWLNKIEGSTFTDNDIITKGTPLFSTGGPGDGYALAVNDFNVKACMVVSGNSITCIFAVPKEIAENSNDVTVLGISMWSHGQYYPPLHNFINNNDYSYVYCTWGFDRAFTPYIPSYNNITDALNALNDNNTGPLPPHDPEYSYNAELGSLQNVYFRQVYDTVNDESIIDITYDQYTSTGIDLSQNGYGIATQVIKKDLSSQIVQISNTIERAWDNAKKIILKIGSDLPNQWQLNWGLPGGGGHSFSFDDEEPANALTKYDILLRPYYFDGSDYSYGDTTIIEDVDINKIGTRMMKNADTTINDDPVDINYTKVKITNYDFTWNSSNISYNEYINYNIMNEETVYNYTLYSDDSTEINNIGYSTTNIYNYDGDNPSFTFNDFDITQQDVINTVKSFKNVWSSIIYFVPHVLGLFAYLPTWALVLVSGCFIILAGVCVVKFVAPLL